MNNIINYIYKAFDNKAFKNISNNFLFNHEWSPNNCYFGIWQNLSRVQI